MLLSPSTTCSVLSLLPQRPGLEWGLSGPGPHPGPEARSPGLLTGSRGPRVSLCWTPHPRPARLAPQRSVIISRGRVQGRDQAGMPLGVAGRAGTHLARPSSCKAVALPGSVGALPKYRRRGCLGCRRLTRPSLMGSQSRLGTSSWLGSRQHSSTSASSGSLEGPSSRPVGKWSQGLVGTQPPRAHSPGDLQGGLGSSLSPGLTRCLGGAAVPGTL